MTTPDTDAAALLSDWTGAYGGQIPFDRVRPAAFKPALEEGMRQTLAEIADITDNPAPPSFDNTIAAFERSGRALDRAQIVYGVWTGSLKTPDVQAVETEMEPVLAAFSDRIVQNTALFARIDAVNDARERSGLTPEQQRLSWYHWTRFVKEGAQLNAGPKARVTAINQELAGLYSQFGHNLLADEGHVLYLKEADLDGLPASLRGAAAGAAEDNGRPGEFAIPNSRSWMDPFLTYSDRRDLREQVWRTYYSRGDNRDANDNTVSIIPAILRLRAEKAALLGFGSYGAWKLSDTMAKTPEHAMEQMMRVWPAAIARVREEVADMQAVADELAGGKAPAIAPWDYRYYAEKVRRARYDLDMEQVKPYLQLDHLREGMFWAASQLYGLSFVKVEGVPVFDPAMSVYEVKDAGGGHRALWYFDPYSRPIKASGAWMEQYRAQEKMDAPVAAIVSNNTNFVKPPRGQPVLVSWDDAVTLFHEFGHALHAMTSDVTYPSLAGTNVARDFVEFPSQLNENWLPTQAVLSRFAVNSDGQPIPQGLVDKILKAGTFNTGFGVTEYLAAAIIDMKLHTTPQGPDDPPIDVDAFEKTALAELGMPSEVVMRHRTAQFGHIFQSDGYAAGYYSYLWAEVLDHDAYEAFTEAGGPYDPAVARRLLDDIMSVGNTVDPGIAYRNFRGRDPDVGAYLRAKGFPAE